MRIIALTERLSAISSNGLFEQLDSQASYSILDMTRLVDVNAVGMLNLLLSVQWLRRHDQKVHVLLPKDPHLLARLRTAHFLGQFRALGVSYTQMPIGGVQRGAMLSGLPVFHLEEQESPIAIAGQVYNHLLGLAGYPTSEAEAVGNLVSELCGNLSEHSHSKGGGFAAIEVQPGIRRPSTVIALGDLGVGLRAKLEGYFHSVGRAVPRFDEFIIRQAMRPGVTSTGELGRGGGLASVRRLARNNGYHLGVRTGNTLLHFAPNGRETAHVGVPFPGVQIYIALEHHVLTATDNSSMIATDRFHR